MSPSRHAKAKPTSRTAYLGLYLLGGLLMALSTVLLLGTLLLTCASIEAPHPLENGSVPPGTTQGQVLTSFGRLDFDADANERRVKGTVVFLADGKESLRVQADGTDDDLWHRVVLDAAKRNEITVTNLGADPLNWRLTQASSIGDSIWGRDGGLDHEPCLGIGVGGVAHV